MKKIMFLLVTVALAAGGCASSTSQYPSRNDQYGYNERYDDASVRETRLEKRLERYADELNLSRRQIRDIQQIQDRYEKRGLSRRERNDRDAYRRIQQQKRREMLSVLTPGQRQRLDQLEQRERGYRNRS